MKKLLYLFIASTIFMSCSSNDDSDLDQVIGTWQLITETENGVDQSTTCSKKSTATFSNNGNFSTIFFYSDSDVDSTCESGNSSGTWESAGNSNYTLTFEDGDSNTTKLNFTDNNNQFSVTTTENYNDQTFTYIETYKRI
jgi:hypothetical protein